LSEVMTEARVSWPRRLHHVAEAEWRFGELPRRLAEALERSDPAADQAVADLEGLPAGERHALIERALTDSASPASESVRALIAASAVVPPWLDWERVARAHQVFTRAGLLGGLALGLSSLVHGYAAPEGNKPLAFSGRLKERADRRLAETGHFITAVTEEGGVRPGALGWRVVLKVRLMHAAVRRLLLASGRWSTEDWSHPINQHDMAATILLFSCVFIDGIRRVGVHVTPAEADDYQHLFRWVGTLIGVEPALLPASYAEAKHLAEAIHLMQGPPDADSRELVQALLEGPLRAADTPREVKRARRMVAISAGLCRSFVGDRLADQLGLPRDAYRHVATGLRATFGVLEHARRGVPGLDLVVRLLGDRYWRLVVSRGLGDVPARFELPEALGRTPRTA
jgi:hypothetical protein